MNLSFPRAKCLFMALKQPSSNLPLLDVQSQRLCQYYKQMWRAEPAPQRTVHPQSRCQCDQRKSEKQSSFSREIVQKGAKVSSLPHGITSDWNKKQRAKVSPVLKGGRNFRIHLPWIQKHCCWNLQSSQPIDPYLYRKSSSTKIYIMRRFVQAHR